MSYLLFKLAFDAPVHFGPSDSALSLYTSEDFFRADTLFSALCHTAGDELDRLVKSVQNDCLRFSDAMPWRGDTLFFRSHASPRKALRTSLRSCARK